VDTLHQLARAVARLRLVEDELVAGGDVVTEEQETVLADAAGEVCARAEDHCIDRGVLPPRRT
jgi:hypothetical protein